MRRTNCLKGLGAKLALALVAFGAVFTSCAKEEFNVEYKTNNAQIIFNPIVIDAATKSIITNAILTGAEPIIGTKEKNGYIEAGSVTITATIEGVSGFTTITYPEVPAGNIITYSPIILLTAKLISLLLSTTTSQTLS